MMMRAMMPSVMLHPSVDKVLIISILILGGCSLHHTKEERKHYRTVHGLEQLQLVLSDYAKQHKTLPPPTFEGLHTALWEKDCEWDDMEIILSGVDFWDRLLVIQQPVECMLLVRSKGKNSIDEDGSGDDIEVCVVVSDGKVWQRLRVGHLDSVEGD